MENEDIQTTQVSEIKFDFLSKESSQSFFAETDFLLRQGKHIQDYEPDKRIFNYLDNYFQELKNYYQFLYSMELKRDYADTEKYYYLDFPEENFGKFGSQRVKTINDKYLLIGVLLLNLFNEKHFEKKRTNWKEISEIVSEKEKKDLWLKLLFPDVRNSQTPTEWKKVFSLFKSALDDFEDLGWIRMLDKNELEIEIHPSIFRIAKLYPTEIENINLLQEQHG
jgi:chromosome condensin MukBEF MukE localization factor